MRIPPKLAPYQDVRIYYFRYSAAAAAAAAFDKIPADFLSNEKKRRKYLASYLGVPGQVDPTQNNPIKFRSHFSRLESVTHILHGDCTRTGIYVCEVLKKYTTLLTICREAATMNACMHARMHAVA